MIRFLIRVGIALLGAAIGFIVAAAVLDDMTLDGAAFVIAIGIFVVLTAVLEPLIEKIGDEHLSIIAMFSSLITTFLALLITELVSDGLNITGVSDVGARDVDRVGQHRARHVDSPADVHQERPREPLITAYEPSAPAGSPTGTR